MKLVNQTNNKQQNVFTSNKSNAKGSSTGLKLLQGMCSAAVFSLCVVATSASVVFANGQLTERPTAKHAGQDILSGHWSGDLRQPDAGQADGQQSAAMQQAVANEAAANKVFVQKVNINLANFEQLVALPGIGKVKATAILEYRKEVGAFNSLADIQNIKGIGSKLFAKLNGLIEI